MYTMLARMAKISHNLANSHTLCENVNVTMITTINVYDMTTIHYLVVKEFGYMWVIAPYFV